jgi:lysozyme
MLNPPMQYSKDGLDLTEQFEGCRYESYPDPASGGDPWTIGYGHTGPDVHQGMIWSDAQCEAALLADVALAVANVNQNCCVPLIQGEFDALVDFAFNCGIRSLDSSTLLKLVNENDMADAVQQFQRWDHAAGQVVAGLLRRRLAEAHEFSTTDPTDSPQPDSGAH